MGNETSTLAPEDIQAIREARAFCAATLQQAIEDVWKFEHFYGQRWECAAPPGKRREGAQYRHHTRKRHRTDALAWFTEASYDADERGYGFGYVSSILHLDPDAVFAKVLAGPPEGYGRGFWKGIGHSRGGDI